jgi:endothelin-converting enzyme
MGYDKIAYNDYANDPKNIIENIGELVNITDFSDLQPLISTRNLNIMRNKVNGLDKFYSWDERKDAVNAYYVFENNEIIIPGGILQTPFFNSNYPLAFNLGGIGRIVAHEFFHAFDNQGHLRDENGDLKDWWSKNSAKKYENSAQCFINQYSNYTMEGFQVNGSLTLGENIADNAGLKGAHVTLKRLLVEKLQQVITFDNLKNFTHEQLFFINFANHQCTKYDPKSIEDRAKYEPHGFSEFRINAVLHNSPEFHQAFKCSKPSEDKVFTLF